jgi:hypothetical protein
VRGRWLIFLVLFCSSLVAFGQIENKMNLPEKKPQYIKLPMQNAVVMSIFQLDCPLKIEEAEAFLTADGSRPVLRYALRNTSTKAVKFYSVSFYRKNSIGKWNVYGIGSELRVGQSDGKGGNLLSGGSVTSNLSRDSFDVIPMNKEVEALFSTPNQSGLKLVWFGMVTKVIFEDGSKYEMNNLPEEVEHFLSELSDK